MEWNRAELKLRAKGMLQNNYGNCVLAAFILSLLTGAGTGSAGSSGNAGNLQLSMPGGVLLGAGTVAILLDVFVINIFETGGCRFFVENRDYKAPVSKILFGFQCGHYGNVVTVMFLMKLKIFLWSLLLLIPGIIKAYEYRMVPYILAEQPDINQADAFAISREMMTNRKMDAFVFDVSFCGWWILSAFTCGILAIFWAAPYQHQANAELYVALRENWHYGYYRDTQGFQGENF